MAKNGESRIPVPRATRPSFFPKPRNLGGSKIGSGQRSPLLFGSSTPYISGKPESRTPALNFSPCAISTPCSETNKGDKTYTISPTWDIGQNDMQQLARFNEEKSFYSLLGSSQVSKIEDVGDSCLVDLSLTSFTEGSCIAPVSGVNGAPITPHYLMLNKQNSFEHDESLGILTPDQMTDFTVALESSRTPSCENLTNCSAASRLALTRASGSARPSSDVEPTEEISSERTPSPEELPLDPKPNVETARVETSVVPVSFVTSVTSITSLEAGYQGDGENSRPASRGADPPLVEPPANLPAAVCCRQDPMTDSDFFTESDADAHEEIVRGDRKAQVIDGTLFCAPGGRRCPSFTGEEMDSSGIYSDLDKRQDEPNPAEEPPEESDDRTPDTVDTEVSQRSQALPVHAEVSHIALDCLAIPMESPDTTSNPNKSVDSADVTVIRVDRTNGSVRAKSASRQTESNGLKKFKMPKRNVASKIKVMIESGPKDDAEKEARRSQRPTRKGGRWDAVMNIIQAGKNEQRSRPPRKEVKSRVFQALSQSSSPNLTLKKAGDNNNNSNPSKDKRRLRGRQDTKSSAQETARSSVRSSMSDLSSPPGKETRKRSPSGNLPRRLVANGRSSLQPSRIANNSDAKKNRVDVSTVNLEKSPSATRKPPVTRRLVSNAHVKQQPVPSKAENKELDVTNNEKQSSPKVMGPVTLVVDREVKENSTGYLARRQSLETRDQSAQTDVVYEPYDVKRPERVVQALSTTVQYLAYELDAFSTPQLKSEIERMKSEWIASRAEIDNLRAGRAEIEERLCTEREEHQRALERLREDLESRHAEEIAKLKQEATKEHRAAIAKLRAEHETELSRRENESKKKSVVASQDASLHAEIESLRSVLELRSQENASLRAELGSIKHKIEDKEALELRLESLEARCEDLKAQLMCKDSFERQLSHDNERLQESVLQISKQNKRLSQRNEELQWRLRQKSEVVTVLAHKLATPPRLSRSQGPEQIEHSVIADKNNQQSTSMVKFMVEKGDSVSWTLEIDEPYVTADGPVIESVGKQRTGNKSVSRHGSLRLGQRRPTNIRARSKSTSIGESARADDTSAWKPQCNSTPIIRRRRNDPSSSSSSTSSSTSTTAGTNSAVSVAVAAAAAVAAADDCNSSQRPQEAGGEAMISEETSASSSEDESSASSDIQKNLLLVSGKSYKRSYIYE